MGNIPMPFQGLTVNSRAWSIERKLVVWKVTSVSACIVGTAVYFRPIEPYFGAQYFGILVPAFVTGYIIINSSEIFAMYMKLEHIFLETCFAVTGAFGSGICGIYQLYRWIEWIVDTFHDPDKDYGMQEFVLAAACIIHSLSLSAVVVLRALESQSLSENEEVTENN